MKDDPSSAVHTETRRLAAIMFTDIVGFSRQMGTDEARMLRLLDMHNQIIQQAVAAHQGTCHQDRRGWLLGRVSLRRARRAVRAAIQAQFHAHNAEKAQGRADSRPHRHSLGRHLSRAMGMCLATG